MPPGFGLFSAGSLITTMSLQPGDWGGEVEELDSFHYSAKFINERETYCWRSGNPYSFWSCIQLLASRMRLHNRYEEIWAFTLSFENNGYYCG